MRYIYSTLRFVPDPARGEFVNFGMIAGSDESQEWELRLAHSMRRARYIDEKGLVPEIWRFAEEIGSKLDSYTEAAEAGEKPEVEVSEKWLSDLQQRYVRVIQLSEPAPVEAEDVEEAFQLLFRHMIWESPTERSSRYTKKPAQAALRRAFKAHGLEKGKNYQERARVRGSHHQTQFDFVVANGTAVQLAHTFSFQSPSETDVVEKVKAWAWTVRDLRESGGRAFLTPDRFVDVPQDVDVEVVYVPPESRGSSVLSEALSAFDALRVGSFAFDHVDAIARRARARLQLAP